MDILSAGFFAQGVELELNGNPEFSQPLSYHRNNKILDVLR